MMGYGQPHNTVREVGTPLFARAMFLEDQSGHRFILVHLEQAFVSLAIKEEITNQLQMKYPEWKITDANLLITAQHTHSAPGGYSHYPFYNFTIPGFQLKVFHTVCQGIIEAINQAFNNLNPVSIQWGEHTIAAEKEVAFNRSMASYLKNPEASLSMNETHLALNRKMEGLTFIDNNGKILAILNWFGVHATSISSFNNKIHHDNKGIAADLYEKNHPGTIAFFLQEAAGDVSPNFIWDKSLKRMRGKFKDQYESAAFNGEIQFREAEKVASNKSIQGEIKTYQRFMDISEVTAPPAHGVAFFQGTLEGPGVSEALAKVLKGISRGVRKKHLLMRSDLHKDFYNAHDPKDVLLDHRSGAFLGVPLKGWKKLPKIPEPTVEFFRKEAKKESINTLPWVPTILPFQLVRIGPLLIVAVPGEITTMSAQRLKFWIKKRVESLGVEHIIISSYSNAYMGYVTTPEEYVTQSYEAGHTVYGIDTLRGIFTGFDPLVTALGDEYYNIPTVKLFKFPPWELQKRSV